MQLQKHLLMLIIPCLFMVCGCNEVSKEPILLKPLQDSVLQTTQLLDSSLLQHSDQHSGSFPLSNTIFTRSTNPAELLAFARTLIGTPYVYGAADTAIGFDCSGFITYVFNHFNIQVPRASVSFINIKEEVPLAAARPGDLVLFTGTDSGSTTVGHMGIIESKVGKQVCFIHASSGKANGVTISPLDAYYKSRFVKLIRVFTEDSAQLEDRQDP